MSAELQNLHKRLVSLFLKHSDLCFQFFVGCFAVCAEETAILVGLETPAGVDLTAIYGFLRTQRYHNIISFGIFSAQVKNHHCLKPQLQNTVQRDPLTPFSSMPMN
jgi:hypothetical protein